MISNSKSFSVLKQQIQSAIDFSVLCCHAVPSLNAYIKAVEKGGAPKLPDADHFKGDPNFDQLRGYIPEYRKNLGKLMFINSFSYFEAYFKSLICEVMEFHGGQDDFVQQSLTRQHDHLLFADREPAKAPQTNSESTLNLAINKNTPSIQKNLTIQIFASHQNYLRPLESWSLVVTIGI